MSNRQQRRAEKAQQRHQKLPRRFKIGFGTPEALGSLGPLCKGRWCVPVALDRHMREAGRAVPDPVHGYFLIDTGASSTCIGLEVALQLGLTETDSRETFGAHGKKENRVFEARFQLDIDDDEGNRSTITMEMAATAIPEIEKMLPPQVFTTADTFPKKLVGLLGRDFLRHGKLTYDGGRGFVEVVLNVDSIPRESK